MEMRGGYPSKLRRSVGQRPRVRFCNITAREKALPDSKAKGCEKTWKNGMMEQWNDGRMEGSKNEGETGLRTARKHGIVE
jgi:hypothetical protein